MLASAKEVEKVLSSSTHIEKSRDYFALKPWLGNALNLAKGPQWVPRRRLLLPAFQFRFLDNFMEVFNEQSVIMKNVLEKECVDIKDVNLFPYACRCTLDVICEAAMGVKIGAQTQKDLDYLKAIVSVSNLIVKRMFRPWLHPDFIWKISPEGRAEKKYLKVLHDFTENVITERRKLFTQNKELENSVKQLNKISDETNDDDIIGTKKHRLAFLDLLLEISDGGKVLTDEEIRNETDIFMVAGHDTSGSGIAWTLFLLGLHPEIQRKVQDEFEDIFDGDKERHVTVADLAKMKYLELCIKEALRLCPPIPVIFRHIYQDIQLDDGKVIPSGTSVALNLLELQRDPAVFPDPLKYDPDRFLPENCIGRNAYAYVPFAAGPRNCIGMRFAQMEVKVILSTLLRNFTFESTESFESIKITPDIALRPKYGLHFNVKKRI
jgi:cytochrome P450 family 4